MLAQRRRPSKQLPTEAWCYKFLVYRMIPVHKLSDSNLCELVHLTTDKPVLYTH